MFEALDKAVQRCIDENVLKEYLLKKRSEVMLMLLTEFNQVLYERTIRGEGRKEGEEEGRKEGEKEERKRLSGLVLSLIKEGRMDDLERAMRDNDFCDQLYEKTIRQEGRREGRQEGENRLRDLVLSLMKEGKMDDMEHAMQDNNFRNQLYQRYNL
jgi:predicted transposase YdaD